MSTVDLVCSRTDLGTRNVVVVFVVVCCGVILPWEGSEVGKGKAGRKKGQVEEELKLHGSKSVCVCVLD